MMIAIIHNNDDDIAAYLISFYFNLIFNFFFNF